MLLKRLTLTSLTAALFFLVFPHFSIVKADIVKINRSENSLTFTGSSGYINVPTANILKGFSIMSYFGFDTTKKSASTAMLRAGVGISKSIEIFAGVDATMHDNKFDDGFPPTALLGIKFNLFNLNDIIETYWTNFSIGFQSTFIFNNMGDDFDDHRIRDYFTSYQLMGMVTWTLPFIDFTFSIGKSFDPDNEISFKDEKTLDIGLGTRLWIYDQGGVFALSAVLDYSNFSYSLERQFQETMHTNEMRLSTALRFAFLRKTILLTVGASDILRGSNPLVFVNLGFALSM